MHAKLASPVLTRHVLDVFERLLRFEDLRRQRAELTNCKKVGDNTRVLTEDRLFFPLELPNLCMKARTMV